MKRRLPLLLLTTALATALATCGPATPEQRRSTTPPGAGGSATQASGVTGTTGPGSGGTAALDPGPTAVKAGSTAAPKFRRSIVGGRADVRSRVRHSWRAGCPVGPVEPRLLRVDHWGLDGKVHLRNPYVTRGGRVSPPAGRPYANRARRAAGMVHGGDAVVRAFAAAGWRWGGYWAGSRDYQHFSATGR
jgi:D-alanyl-D-alanine carboxypeptidase